MTSPVTNTVDIKARLQAEIDDQKARGGEEDADARVYLAWAALEEIERLCSQLTASEKDAARYRWLRRPEPKSANDEYRDFWQKFGLSGNEGETMDAMVDAAMENPNV